MPYTPITTKKKDSSGYQPVVKQTDQGGGYRIGPMTQKEIEDNTTIDFSRFLNDKTEISKPGNDTTSKPPETKKTVGSVIANIYAKGREAVQAPFRNQPLVFGGQDENLISDTARMIYDIPGRAATVVKALVGGNERATAPVTLTKEEADVYGEPTYKSAYADAQERIAKGDGAASAYIGAVSNKALDILFGAQMVTSFSKIGADVLGDLLVKRNLPTRINAWKQLGLPAKEDVEIAFKKRATQLHPDKPTGNTKAFAELANAKAVIDASGIPTKAELAATKGYQTLEQLSRQTKLGSESILNPNIGKEELAGQRPLGGLPELPGTREVPGQAPAMGLSTKKVEPVGYKNADDFIAKKGLDPNSVMITDSKNFIVENTSGNKAILTELPITAFGKPKFTTLNQNKYTPGKKITDPIEVTLQNGEYTITDGANRFTQAVANGDKTIPVILETIEIVPETSSLIAEAKKYDTAEEFVKAQGTPVYRGQSHEGFTAFDGKGGKQRFLPDMKGTSFSKTKESALNYGDKIIDGVIPNNQILKSVDVNPMILSDIKSAIKKLSYDDYVDGTGFEDIVSQLAKIAKNKNKGAIDLTDFFPKSKIDSEIRVLTPESFKTKSQLTDIWNKAQGLDENSNVAFAKKTAYNVGDEISNKIPLKLPAIQAPSEAESVKRLGGNDATSKGFVDIRGKTAKSMEDLAAILKDFRNPSREILHFVYLDKGGKILAHTAITSNRIDLVQMTKKEFSFKLQDRAKKLGADTIYTAHNHPSGNVEPSQADEAILLKAATGNELVKGGIILDHNKATFMKVDKSNKPIVGIDTTEKPIDLGKSYAKSDQKISSPLDFLIVAQKQHAFDSGKVGIFTVSTDMQLQDYQTIKINPDKIEETIKQFIKSSDAHYAFIALRQDEVELLPRLDVLDIAISDGKDIFSLKKLGNTNQFKTSQNRFKENHNSIRLFEKEGEYGIQNESSDIEQTIESELGISEEELNQALNEYNQITPKIGKAVTKTPMKDFVATLKPGEFSALKPDQQAYALKYAPESLKNELEGEMIVKEAKGEAGPIEQAASDLLTGKEKIDLAERRTEFREMFGDKLYYKINKTGGTPIDHYVENRINTNLSQRIEIDDFLEAMWRAVKQQKTLKPIQLEARRKFREARQAQIKRRFTLEQVAKKIEKERAVKTNVVQKIIEQKRKTELELKNLVQISKSRREKIDTIQDYFGLTDYEMSKVQGRKDIRTMNEAEFEQFLHEISNKAQLEVELSDARAQVKGTIYSKELVGWENLQRAMSLPPIDKMSISQLKEFDSVLSQYEPRDEFLSQRKLETIDKTDFKGVKTLREARAKVAQKLGVDPSKLDIGVSEFDRMRWDTALAERDPFYRYFVEGFNASILEGEAVFLEQVNKINELFSKLKGRGKFVPQDKKIMQYLESENKAEVAKTMTPEEITAAEYVRLQLQEAYKYELETKMLKGSRYEDLYLPHIQRTFLEAVKDSGVKQAFKEMFEQHKMDEKVMTILDQKTGEILPYEKFFRFALRRSGEVIPTQNVARAFLQYMKAFERKRALDRIIPEIMTAVDVVSPRQMTERGLAMDDRLKTFVTEYLNTKKGRPVKMFVKPGGSVDFILKSVKAFTNMMDLAINIPLQLGSRGGAEASSYVELGAKKYTLGKYRSMTKQGRELVKKFENFTGRTPWNDLHDASQGLPEKMRELMFALFRDATVKANKTFLLGNLTPEEFATGIITPQRLASLQIDLGRWLPVEGTKSILGSTVEGGLATQYRTWAIPIVRTTLKNLADLVRMIKSKEFKKAGKSREFMELFRVAQVTAVVALIALAVEYDPNKKNQSFLEKTLSNSIRDSLSIVSAYDPNTWMNGVRILGFTESLLKALSDIVRLTEYKTSGNGYKKGDLKGVQEMQNLFTPSIMKQMFPPKKKSTSSGGLMF